ncbi:MAG: LPS export ABC transporter periplasmic protein LptC [Limnobacter sp.]|nr:LPS export ABC transporter periplasmic protein LptC [Limnobacter sp.]
MARPAGSMLAQFSPLLLTLVLASGSYWLARQSELGLLGMGQSTSDKLPDYYFTEFRSERYEVFTGRSALLTGNSAQHTPATDTLVISSPKAYQYEGGNTVKMHAETAFYQVEKDLITLKGNAVVVQQAPPKTTTIRADTLVSNGPQHTVSSTSKTLVEQGNRTLQTDSFTFNTESGEGQAQGKVQLIVKAPES